MTSLLAGVDIGGSKTHLRVEQTDGALVTDTVVPSIGWKPRPEADAASWIQGLLAAQVPRAAQIIALVVGAHGYDTDEQAAALQSALSGSMPYPCQVVNDAELVVPAAGISEGIGLIVGTGSIAVGHTPAGSTIYAGGWGWELGDEGSAPAILRGAVRAVLRNDELRGPADQLGDYLLGTLGVARLADIPDRLRRNAGAAAWGMHAPAVFAAADAGSVLADRVIGSAGGVLAELIQRLRRRGVESQQVVAAGGVIVNQPRLRTAIEAALMGFDPPSELQLLLRPPVQGALQLAGALAPIGLSEPFGLSDRAGLSESVAMPHGSISEPWPNVAN